MEPTLVLAGVLALSAGGVYLYVARRLPAPTEPPGSRRAMRMFSLWWYALALNITLVGLTYFVGASGALTLEVQFASSHLQRLLLAVSMVGIMQYMLYLLTGRDLFVPLVALYGSYFLVLSYTLLAQQPVDVYLGPWRTDIVFARPDIPGMRIAGLAVILGPPVVCALLYLRLGLRAPNASRRWRSILVSVSLLLWWAIAVVAGQRALLDHAPLQALNRILSVVAALAVLAAYSPPQWAQRRWGITASNAA